MKLQRTLRWLLALGAAVALTGPQAVFADTSSAGLVAGKVHGASNPVSAARVYTYQLADLTLRQVVTDARGNFLFRDLPAGLYKVIAHKPGFLPTVVMLARGSSSADQFLDLELLAEDEIAAGTEQDFWSVRQKIPTDVLREIGLAPAAVPGRRADRDEPRRADLASLHLPNAVAGFQAEMQALAGVDNHPLQGESQVSGGRLGVDGVVGNTQVDFRGFFMEMQGLGSQSQAPTAISARQSAMSLEVRGEGSSRVNLESRSNRLLDGGDHPVDFERYLVSWTAPLGSRGRSEFSAQYTAENNFYRPDWVDTALLPDASRTLRLQGSYSTTLGDTGTLQTELRYRERQIDGFDGDHAVNHGLVRESVELLGQGGWRVQPKVLVEYGLMTKLRDGSLSVTPRGGVVLQLGELWQAMATASYRVHDENAPLYQDFLPALFQQSSGCSLAEESCYKVALTRGRENGGNSLSLGALHREIGETLRLFFDEDFFNHLESLYLVRGDELPEIQFAVTRRISPTILARLESNLAEGGGGLVPTTSDDVLENNVRYLVTSLDTQFQGTATGVYLAFHQLQQELTPLDGEGPSASQLDMERLQVKLTQDLNVLLDLTADWAVHLDMEVSRGSSWVGPAHTGSGDALRKRILGGLAVRF